jgi:hypothetical protein
MRLSKEPWHSTRSSQEPHQSTRPSQEPQQSTRPSQTAKTTRLLGSLLSSVRRSRPLSLCLR